MGQNCRCVGAKGLHAAKKAKEHKGGRHVAALRLRGRHSRRPFRRALRGSTHSAAYAAPGPLLRPYGLALRRSTGPSFGCSAHLRPHGSQRGHAAPLKNRCPLRAVGLRNALRRLSGQWRCNNMQQAAPLKKQGFVQQKRLFALNPICLQTCQVWQSPDGQRHAAIVS